MIIVKVIVKAIDIISAICMIYYIITGIFVLKKGKKIKQFTPKSKFAVIIPARNEEAVIGNLLDSLNNQTYPKELYDVFVLPNNCIDNTKDVSKSKNAKIIDCNNLKINSKGDVLRYAFSYLNIEGKYNAYIIFDADNIVHPEFIQKMNNMLCSGYKLAQGYRDSKNPSDTWISSSYSIHYLVQNYFLNKSRMNIDRSSFINGTGFMISKEILEEKEYYSETMTEDIELTVKCALDNERIGFAEDAITYDEQPIKFIESWKQRKRWSIGTIQCLKKYSNKLFLDIIKNKNFASVDSMIFLQAPLIQLISAFNFMLHILVNSIENIQIDYFEKLFLVIMWYITSIILSVYIVKANKKEIKKYIKGIIALPIFYFSWIPINIVALFEKNFKWEKIEHTRTISLDNILNLNYMNKNRVKNEE